MAKWDKRHGPLVRKSTWKGVTRGTTESTGHTTKSHYGQIRFGEVLCSTVPVLDDENSHIEATVRVENALIRALSSSRTRRYFQLIP